MMNSGVNKHIRYHPGLTLTKEIGYFQDLLPIAGVTVQISSSIKPSQSLSRPSPTTVVLGTHSC